MINAISTIFAQMLDPHRIEFPNLGFGFNIDPTAFTIFGLDIQWYGIIITIGLILAIIYVFPRMKRFGIDSDRAVDAVIGGVLGGIIGARLFYVAMRWEEYNKGSFGETFKAVINTRNGGLAIYGGLPQMRKDLYRASGSFENRQSNAHLPRLRCSGSTRKHRCFR